MRRISCNSESGAILLIVIILMLALTITGIAFLNAGVMEYRLAKREDYKNKAFYIAEGGLERTIWNLKQHFATEFETRWPTEGEWPTGLVNGIPVYPLNSSPWTIQYEMSSLPGNLGGGSYVVEMHYETEDGEDRVRIESTGTVEGTSRTVQIYMELEEFFPFDTAIFAGESAVAGSIINGNVRVHGSIVILAEHLGEPLPEEPAVELMDLSGDAGIRNNYEGMKPELEFVGGDPLSGRRIPECPSPVYEDPLYPPGVQSLKATLRVRKGAVKLGGSVTIGEDNILLPDVKGFMDGLYVDRGFILYGSADLYSDENEASSGLGGISFPTLTEPGPEDPDADRIDYLDDNSLHITVGDGGDIPESKISSEFDFESTSLDPKGAISWYFDPDEGTDGKIYLNVRGIVWIDEDFLDIGDIGEKKIPIEYSGSGVIVVARRGSIDPNVPEYKNIEGQIRVHGHLLAQGEYDPHDPDKGGFPNNVLGLITGRMELATGEGEAQLTMTGAFFAENEIVSAKQNEIAGTFITRQFNIAKNVPRLYQVPKLKDAVLIGFPGGLGIKYLLFTRWSES